ncbi:hypothetical protein KIS4809_0183 [Bacillus sp. ZZV12-4809]|nr:hypothetical protein KIS4809_0183 [Bacillus sp. ZZV12-4809]
MNYILESPNSDKNMTLEQAINGQYTMAVFIRHLG